MVDVAAVLASRDRVAEAQAELRLFRKDGDDAMLARELMLVQGEGTTVEADSNTLMDLALAAESNGFSTLACICWAQALLADHASTDAATNLGVLLKCLGKLPEARKAHLHAQATNGSLRSTESQRLLDGGQLFGKNECEQAVLHEAARVLREVLLLGGYSADAVQRQVLALGEEGGPPTGMDLFLRRESVLSTSMEAGDRLGILLLLFACGIALPAEVVQEALGCRDCERLLECGLLLRVPPADADVVLVVSPVQVYPLLVRDIVEDSSHSGRESVFVATDWDLESLLPPKYSVMSVGVDSLNLVYLSPRVNACERILDLCCGSGVQALAAACRYPAAKVVAADINPRAIRFCKFNAELNCFADRLKPVVSDCYESFECSGPFDIILANPPFVAMPRPPEGATEAMEWALYADGGPDGMHVVKAIVEGACSRLQPGGHLALVSEFANIIASHVWLPADGLDFSLCYNSYHVQDCREYAKNRAEERGWPWASEQEWLLNLKSHGVEAMASSGLLLAVRPATVTAAARHRAAIAVNAGGPDSENLSLLASAKEAVMAEWAKLLPNAAAAAVD